MINKQGKRGLEDILGFVDDNASSQVMFKCYKSAFKAASKAKPLLPLNPRVFFGSDMEGMLRERIKNELELESKQTYNIYSVTSSEKMMLE